MQTKLRDTREKKNMNEKEKENLWFSPDRPAALIPPPTTAGSLPSPLPDPPDPTPIPPH